MTKIEAYHLANQLSDSDIDELVHGNVINEATQKNIEDAVICCHCAKKFLSIDSAGTRMMKMRKHPFYGVKGVWADLAFKLTERLAAIKEGSEMDAFVEKFLNSL